MANTNTDLAEVVSISVSSGGSLITTDNPNICSIITSSSEVLSTADRARAYTNEAAVAEDFGTTGPEYKHAQVFFAQETNPVGAGGYLVIGYHRAVDENVAATAGKLVGVQLSEVSLIGELQQITDGSFDVNIDGVTQNVTGLDFSTSLDFDDVITLLNANITGATATEQDQKIVIASDTTGAASSVSLLTPGATGTFIGEILALATGTGAVSTDGEDASVLVAETKVDAVNAIRDVFKIKSFVFIDNPTDVESEALALYCQSSDLTSFDVFDADSNLTIDLINVCWTIKQKGYTNYRMIHDKLGQRTFATAEMSRGHVVNFNGENTAMTLQLKEMVGIAPSYYSTGELKNADAIGLDVYVTFKDTPKLLTASGNDFFDNRYNLIALKDALQVAYFNTLAGTSTKIPQTEQGVLSIKKDLDETLARFVKAGVLAGGKWNSSDFFGNRETFVKNIENKGYYILFQKVADQAQTDRETRIAPVVQIASKLAGSIHKGQIIIRVEK